jgi:hypothetical protein
MSKEIPVITVAEIKKYGLEAYKNKRLTAQHPDRSKRVCQYNVGRKYHCVIGAALAARGIELKPEESHSRVYDLTSVQFDDVDKVGRIQSMHDFWADYALFDGLNAKLSKSYEKELFSLLTE